MAESPTTATAEPAPSLAAPPPAVEPSAAPAEADGEASDHKRKLGDLDLNGEGEAPLKKQDVAADAETAAAEVLKIDSGAAAEVLKIDSGAAAENVEPEALAAENGELEAAAVDVAVSESNGSGEEASEVEVKESVETTTTVITVESLTVAASERASAAIAAGSVGVPAEAAADGGGEAEKPDAGLVGNGQHPEHAPVESHESAPTLFPTTGQPALSSSRKIEIPNNKVGVLIGKAGETIKNLQFSSGAKIQIARDAEVDPLSSTRPVEIIGTSENIDKAERLIRDVIAEADAGGSPALVAKGFGSVQSGGEYIEMPVPNEKVGMIIGKGGETIKNLQTQSGARVQLIPQHLPAGDTSKERVVRITGHKSQIESAREMVKEVMNKVPRPSNLSGKYNQQNLRPRVPPTHSQWGPRAAAPTQQMTGYDYPQRGAPYPSQATQYPQTYGGYSQQPPSRSNISAGWDQRQTAPAQGTLQTGGYDYYGQGTPAAGVQSSNAMSTLAPASMTPAPVNYNYGQSQASVYGQPPPYAQSGPTQQGYGQGYSEPKYDQPPQSQQMYGQQASSQPAAYGHQSGAPQSGYPQQQPYGRPGYANPVQEVPQTYGAPRASQPGDPVYQGQVPPSHVQAGVPQQSYPYGSSAPAQPVSYGQYGPTSGTVDGYAQPSSATYPQQGQVAPGYAQGGQPMPAYAQSGPQSGGYVQQYSQTQPSYVDQSAPSNVNYGYQGGPVDPGYASNVQVSGYPTPVPGGQTGYVQQPQPGYYEQSVPAQSVQGTVPGTAPVVYGGQVYGQN